MFTLESAGLKRQLSFLLPPPSSTVNTGLGCWVLTQWVGRRLETKWCYWADTLRWRQSLGANLGRHFHAQSPKSWSRHMVIGYWRVLPRTSLLPYFYIALWICFRLTMHLMTQLTSSIKRSWVTNDLPSIISKGVNFNPTVGAVVIWKSLRNIWTKLPEYPDSLVKHLWYFHLSFELLLKTPSAKNSFCSNF